jgi:hypothetical protein
MQDLKARRQKLLVDALDCQLIASLATDPIKRETFRQLAVQYQLMADDLDDVIAAQEQTKDAA